MAKKGGTTTTSNTPTLDPQSQAYLDAYRTSAQGNAGQANTAANAMAAGGQQLMGGLPYAMQTGLNGIDAYMSPYTSQVIGQIQQEGNRQSTLAGNQAADLATKAGAFGGDRSAVLSANMQRDIGQGTQNAVANASSTGFENAVQQLMQSRQMQGQYGMQGLGLLGQAQGIRNSGLQGLQGGMGQYGNTQSQTTPGDPWGFWGGLAGAGAGAALGAA